MASRERDPVSYDRSAIEPHEQDQYPKAVDVLIDAVRDTLEWLATNEPALLDGWVDRLATSDAPLLRRLAIHSITAHPDKSADDRLKWLLDRVDLHNLSEHHEIHRAVKLSYAIASDEARQAVVDAVLTYQLPASEDLTAEKQTARSHFDWLSWLLRAKHDCAAAEAALAPIRATYPDWQLSEHPDLTLWQESMGWVEHKSPWSIEQLLARTPGEQLDDLLNFNGKWPEDPNREGLIATIRDTCKQSKIWAFGLAKVLTGKSLWASDLWPAMIRGIQEAGLTEDDWYFLLTVSANPELLATHAHDIANLLYALVRDGGKPFSLKLLEQANGIALLLWQTLQPDTQDCEIDKWLLQANNRPSGVIVDFWIKGLSLLMHGKQGTERTLPDHYQRWFTMVVEDTTSNGGFGRSILVSQTAFLFGLDKPWTLQHLIPLFSEADRHKFAQAWDGYLIWGRLNPALVDALMPAILGALPRLSANLPDRQHRFIEFYTTLAMFHVADPREKLLPELFKKGSTKDRICFASHLGYFLRQMQPATKLQMWDTWLHRYWQDRLDGVLATLEKPEIQKMLEWLPHLGEIFPVASLLAARAPIIKIEHSHLLYELHKSDLVTRYPTETAELLIYLCKCVVGYQTADLKRIADHLPPLVPTIQRRLNEALAVASG